MHARWPFFASLISTLEMALFKTDLGVAERYLRLVDARLRDRFWPQIADEHARLTARLLEITGEPRLLASTPALLERLSHRNPWVDPLNHLQVELLSPRCAPGASDDRARAARDDLRDRAGCATRASEKLSRAGGWVPGTRPSRSTIP